MTFFSNISAHTLHVPQEYCERMRAEAEESIELVLPEQFQQKNCA